MGESIHRGNSRILIIENKETIATTTTRNNENARTVNKLKNKVRNNATAKHKQQKYDP